MASKKKKKDFKLRSNYSPSGDQPTAIKEMVENIVSGQNHQVLLGVTGSGKTFSIANVIERLNRPTLILAPNKTLAAQLYGEYKELFPENAVEYFVSYYDYYQPEAYIPATNTFIEKDSAINEQIDRMRHSATRSLFEREDVLIVSSVSCIYGLGSPESYQDLAVPVAVNQEISRDKFLRELVRVQYKRSDVDFYRGSFRVRGDIVEVFPPYEEEKVIRVEFFGDYVDRIGWVDPLRGEILEQVESVDIYPGSHYVSTDEKTNEAVEAIRDELRDRIQHYRNNVQYLEAERIEQRTMYDLELILEMGFCPGIENYSRHFTGRGPGESPPTLIEYFPKNFLVVIDESHVTVPQIGGMYRGDRARKLNLVEHGFRLPSALDNRPLSFKEFEGLMNNVIYVSATPGDYELQKSGGVIVEQIIRPTGLIDPEIEIRTSKHQVDDLLGEIRLRVDKKERVLITTLTKKLAEELTDYYENLGVKVKYLHSDIHTVERSEILRDLRLGIFDVLVGINLLREGLDLPEVSLVAITEADKEGFLRSERSLIQTIGRAARNANGKVILYANKTTDSMAKAIFETDRRRQIQQQYNKQHGITPQTVKTKIKGLMDYYTSDKVGEQLLDQQVRYLTQPKSVSKEIEKLKKKMKKHATDLEFELAAQVRDEIKRLQLLELSLHDGSVETDNLNAIEGDSCGQE